MGEQALETEIMSAPFAWQDDDDEEEEDNDDDIFCLHTVDYSNYLLYSVLALLQLSSIISDFSCHFSRRI